MGSLWRNILISPSLLSLTLTLIPYPKETEAELIGPSPLLLWKGDIDLLPGFWNKYCSILWSQTFIPPRSLCLLIFPRQIQTQICSFPGTSIDRQSDIRLLGSTCFLPSSLITLALIIQTTHTHWASETGILARYHSLDAVENDPGFNDVKPDV